MLDVEDVEDVACPVNDMEATGRSRSLVQRSWSEGRGHKGTRAEMMSVTVLGGGDARLWTPLRGYYGIIWSRPPHEAPKESYSIQHK